MLNWRLYRAALLPVALALAIAGFSLHARPPALTSSLAPDAFEGARAFAELESLAREYPDRRPGSEGDDRLAAHIAAVLESLGAANAGGFTVHRYTFRARTASGEQTLTNVVAQRPGSTEEEPLLIVAHRDSATAGNGRAELSGTAALLELARVFAARETRREIVLASTSGGSSGDGGVTALIKDRPQLAAIGPFDAAIVLGDVAGARPHAPFVLPYSDGSGSAPEQLQHTLDSAITQQTGLDPGAPSVVGQLAHLAFHYTVGEEGPLDAGRVPAVLEQVSGERGPSARAAVKSERIEGFGRAALAAVDALDVAPDVSDSMQTGLLVQRQLIAGWALRLLALALLIGPLLVTVDALARERRRERAGWTVPRWIAWTLSLAVPFLLAALFARLLGVSGAIAGAPSEPVAPAALDFGAAAVRAVAAVALVLVLALLLWPAAVRRLGLTVRPDPQVAGLGVEAVLVAVALVVWVVNPVASLLLVVAAHLWLVIASPELRPRPFGALALVALALVPLALLVGFFVLELGLGPGQLAWTIALLLAGGHIGIVGAALWSIAFGCAAAAASLSLALPAPERWDEADEEVEITIRGPLSYAGPGSLGGTESALRK